MVRGRRDAPVAVVVRFATMALTDTDAGHVMVREYVLMVRLRRSADSVVVVASVCTIKGRMFVETVQDLVFVLMIK